MDGKLEAHLQAGNERLRQPAVNVLTELHRNITDFNRFQDKYGLRQEPLSPTSDKVGAQQRFESPGIAGRFRNELTLRAKWVIADKSLCSSNILFFPSHLSAAAAKDTAVSAGIPDISTPYLLGFDASKPDGISEMSLAPKNPAASDLHRHLSSLNGMSRKPYCRSFDINSLGLILLEAGL